jgi:hypothetical protein
VNAKPDYTAFLIRLWREPAADRDWIVQAEHIPTGERQYFASVDALFEFIRTRLPGPRAAGDGR